MPERLLVAADADRWPALPGRRPRRAPSHNSRAGAARRAEYAAEPPGPLASCEMLLDELLTALGRLEADFKVRWDAAQLGASS